MAKVSLTLEDKGEPATWADVEGTWNDQTSDWDTIKKTGILESKVPDDLSLESKGTKVDLSLESK